ncbi:MAG: hypothetical protein ACRDHP_01230 [Ktedonobacterales bacterium]
MESLDSETVFALTALLEDMRASVEILVELANGATEVAEREACAAMGQDAVLLCCALRERITTAGVFVPRHINAIVLHILDVEYYDDRLRAFGRHQAGICERAQTLPHLTEDAEARKVARDLYDAGVQSALWCEQRAATFAGSRLLDFRATRPASAPPGPREHDSSDADTPLPRLSQPALHQGNGATYPEQPHGYPSGERTEQPYSQHHAEDGAAHDGR